MIEKVEMIKDIVLPIVNGIQLTLSDLVRSLGITQDPELQLEKQVIPQVFCHWAGPSQVGRMRLLLSIFY